MKILIICSKAFYHNIKPIKEYLEKKDFTVCLPNCYDKPEAEKEMWRKGNEMHSKFKKDMFKQSEQIISEMDAVLTLNFEKHGQANYIGGATFLELYEAFMKNKRIYLYNEIPKGILYDEVCGFNPIIINGNLDLIK